MSHQEPITKNPSYSLSDYEGIISFFPELAIVTAYLGEEGDILCLEVEQITGWWMQRSLN